MQADRFTIKSQEALAAAQRLAGARRNPEVAPAAPARRACSSRRAASSCPSCAARAPTPSASAARNEALDALPTVTGEASARPRSASGLIDLLQPADEEARGLGDEYVSTEHLLLALAAEPAIDAPAPRATSSPRPSSRCAARTA